MKEDTCQGNSLTKYFCGTQGIEQNMYNCPNGCKAGDCVGITICKEEFTSKCDKNFLISIEKNTCTGEIKEDSLDCSQFVNEETGKTNICGISKETKMAECIPN